MPKQTATNRMFLSWIDLVLGLLIWVILFGVIVLACIAEPGCVSSQAHPPTSMPSSESSAPVTQTGVVNTSKVSQGGDDWDSRLLAGGIAISMVLSVISYPLQRRWRLGTQKAKELAKG